jgi:hypothetical protein
MTSSVLFIDASNEAPRQGAGALKKPDVWQSHAVAGRCGACPSRVTPVLHLNTGVFFCEDTFLWFRTVTVRRREMARHPLKRRLIPDLRQKNIMYYRYIIFSFGRFLPINSCGFFVLGFAAASRDDGGEAAGRCAASR